MGWLRNTLATAAVGAALAAPSAQAAEPAALGTSPATKAEPASTTVAPAASDAPVQHGDELVAPPVPEPNADSGGTSAGEGEKPGGGEGEKEEGEEEREANAEAGGTPSQPPPQLFEVPSIPSSSCAASGVPPILVPIYQRAAGAYGLGPHGPAILAGINEVETAFGTNLNVSSAGAEGWMQFMPSTWETYGVDANNDGVADPYNPEDAIFAAARYLSAAGMPSDTYGAIYAYNHADWYVSEVLANAGCYGSIDGAGAGAASLTPQLQVLSCNPAPGWRDEIPADYMSAFEKAAARYELGQRGVWALAAVARLESNFGGGMTPAELREAGPLGLQPSEWRHFAVDGDEDGKIEHASPADSAATLARLIWAHGSLRAGIFACLRG